MRDFDDVWSEISDNARDLMLRQVSVLTLDQGIANLITEVNDRSIARRSDAPKNDSGVDSRIASAQFGELWRQLEDRDETYEAGPVAFVYALIADVIPGVAGTSGPLRLYFTDREAAERQWEGSADSGRVRLFNAIRSLDTFVDDGQPAPHKAVTMLLLLQQVSEQGADASLIFADSASSFHDLLRLAGPQYTNASYSDPFWRLRTSGIWTVTPAPHERSEPPAAQLLRDQECVAMFTPQVTKAITADPSLAPQAMAELITLYVPGYAQGALRSAVGVTEPSGPSISLREALGEAMGAVAAAASQPSEEAQQRVRRAVTARCASAVRQLTADSGWQVRASAGVGTAAAVPWVAAFAPEHQPNPRAGVYVCYLIAADGSACYLTIIHAAEQLKGGVQPLTKRSLDLRQLVTEAPDGATIDISLASRVDRARRYEAATVFAKRYAAQEVPDDENLAKDLEQFERALKEILRSGVEFSPLVEPFSIVFKWNADREPRTVLLHEELAQRDGAVWWGRLGSQNRKALASARINDLNEQVRLGLLRHVYLYRRDNAWRADLVQISENSADVDADPAASLPSYYVAADCNLFVKLENLIRVEDDDVRKGLLLASNPTGSEVWEGALRNQTNPLLAYERLRPDEVTESAAARIEANAHAGEPNPVTEALTLDWLQEQTYWDRDRLEEVLASLQDVTPQVVLAGPPGTGKTYVAERIARYLTGDEPLAQRTVQFHPTYGYEEFVEGLRPELTDKEQLVFRPSSGVIVSMTKDMEGSSEPRVLIIDEMNRANLPRVFGELLYLLEYRGQPINLLYTEDFALPANLHIIGTINTADRSIRSIDVALRRRFDFFECPPDPQILERHYAPTGRGTTDIQELTRGFRELNAKLAELLDHHHTIGHSFFMQPHFNRTDLHRVWRHQILPLLEDYFFDDPDLLEGLVLRTFWPDAA